MKPIVPEVEKERVLIAMTSEQNEDGEIVGCLGWATCILLSASQKARMIIENVGDTEFVDWLVDNGAEPPPRGGLWVVEFQAEEDAAAPRNFWARNIAWRLPTITELEQFLRRQKEHMPKDPEGPLQFYLGDGTWAHDGALI